MPRSAPGDRLRVRLTDRRLDYGRAEILEILEPGPGRRTPPCPFFERCGGCDLQHLDESAQLRLKAQAATETLRRLGGIETPPEMVVIPGKPWGYRLRSQLQVGSGDRGVEVGYFSRRSHQLVAIDRCPVLVPELEAVLPDLPGLLADQSHRRLDLAAGDGGEWTSSPWVEGLPHGEVSVQIGKLAYAYDARCFFQGHLQLLPELVEQAVGEERGERAVELYSGVGLFSLPLAERYGQVTAVETERVAARFARQNARRNRIHNLHVETLAVESWIKKLPAELDRVLVDPPRGGLSAKVRRALLEAAPRRLTYVSCHPATLARDLRILMRRFHLARLVLLDLFPQTGHMEAIVQLHRKDDPVEEKVEHA